MSGIVCMLPVYEFKNWTFEKHSYCGPWPLDEEGNPYNDVPEEFWDIYDSFNNLSEDEQNNYLIVNGGCIQF